MLKNVIIIDITEPGKLLLILLNKGRYLTQTWQGPRLNSLFCLDNFLKKSKITLKKIKGFVLLEGGGSFSAVRSAAAILNTIRFGSGQPVVGLNKRKIGRDWPEIFSYFEKNFFRLSRRRLIKPLYTGEPNIT